MRNNKIERSRAVLQTAVVIITTYDPEWKSNITADFTYTRAVDRWQYSLAFPPKYLRYEVFVDLSNAVQNFKLALTLIL